MIYPIVEFAHKIGKNTADFTTKDLSDFTKWWMKHPQSKEMIQAIKEQQRKSKLLHEQLQAEKEEDKMARKHTTASFQQAQTSRLAERGIESPINDGQEEIVIHPENEIVASMELDRTDVDALLFAITRVFEDYEMEGHEYGKSLSGIKEGLEGV